VGDVNVDHHSIPTSNCVSVGRRQKTAAFDAVFGVVPTPRAIWGCLLIRPRSIVDTPAYGRLCTVEISRRETKSSGLVAMRVNGTKENIASARWNA
jgi:hypothetical protein